MRHTIGRILVSVFGIIAIVFAFVWLLLSSSFLSGPRGQLTEWILERETGQDLQINGGVLIDIGPVLMVTAEDLALPSPSMADVELAKIGNISFGLSLSDLFRGKIELEKLRLDRIQANLIVDNKGTASWMAPNAVSTKPTEPEQKAALTNSNAVLSIISDRKVHISAAGITYRNAQNGFEFDLELGKIELEQSDPSSPVTLNADGHLNDQALKLTGSVDKNRLFDIDLTFDNIGVKAKGTPNSGGPEKGITVSVDASVADLGQLQDVLKLNKVLKGTATASAEILVGGNDSYVGTADLLVTLDGGQSVSVKRTLGTSDSPATAVLDTMVRLYPEASPPPKATRRRNLKLVSVFMQLAERENNVPLRKMVIETNGLTLDTGGEGPPPVTVSDISRTKDGQLRIGAAKLLLGPPESPIATLEGEIGNALELQDIDIGANLALPAASLFAPELFQTSKVLGELSGGFKLEGGLEKLVLSDLKADLTGTDLWALDVAGSVGNILTFDDISLDLKGDVPSGEKLLDAMGLKPINTGSVHVSAALKSDGADWTSNAKASVAKSNLTLDLSLDAADPSPVMRGSVKSDLIQLSDLRNVIAAIIQLGRLGDIEASKLKDRESSSDSETGATSAPGPFRDVTLLPLGRAVLLSGMDVAVTLDLHEVVGDKETTSLNTELEMKAGKLSLGPAKFNYGGGHFDVTASMDLKENPDVLSVAGSTNGWDVGKIMHALDVKQGVSGILNASFELAGHHTSVKDFVGTASGWSTVSLSKGSIETQLLDIAGLGIIPWLFTKHKGKTAPIVCMRAPLSVSKGVIASKSVVVETDEVQLVIYGDVDLKNKTLDLHGQPRRIGKPLSRSPWPFSLSGSLNKPKVKVKDGPKKLVRKDGASTMPSEREKCVPDILQLK